MVRFIPFSRIFFSHFRGGCTYGGEKKKLRKRLVLLKVTFESWSHSFSSNVSCFLFYILPPSTRLLPFEVSRFRWSLSLSLALAPFVGVMSAGASAREEIEWWKFYDHIFEWENDNTKVFDLKETIDFPRGATHFYIKNHSFCSFISICSFSLSLSHSFCLAPRHTSICWCMSVFSVLLTNGPKNVRTRKLIKLALPKGERDQFCDLCQIKFLMLFTITSTYTHTITYTQREEGAKKMSAMRQPKYQTAENEEVEAWENAKEA